MLTVAQYANRRGVTPEAVRKAAKSGRITLVDGKIDPARADAEWEASTDPGQGVNAPAVRANGDPLGNAGEASGSASPALNTFAKSRARRELANARKAELELAELEGALVRVEDVSKAWFAAARRTRDALRGMIERAAPRLAAESDPEKCRALLQEEVDLACAELSRGAKAGPGG